MSGKTDVVKGRIKEAAGVLTGNDKLRAEGKADQAVGEVKQVAEKTVDNLLAADDAGDLQALAPHLRESGLELGGHADTRVAHPQLHGRLHGAHGPARRRDGCVSPAGVFHPRWR